MLSRKDKTELDIVLNRAGYVLTICVAFAVVVVMILIFK